jgi:hypothetical protein
MPFMPQVGVVQPPQFTVLSQMLELFPPVQVTDDGVDVLITPGAVFLKSNVKPESTITKILYC